MFVYFEVIRMDTDINISEALCLSKVTISNVQLKIMLLPIFTTIKMFPRARTTPPVLWVKWAVQWVSRHAEMSPYILITTSLLSADLGTLSTLRRALPSPGFSLSLWGWTGPLSGARGVFTFSRTSSQNFSGKLSIVSRLL